MNGESIGEGALLFAENPQVQILQVISLGRENSGWSVGRWLVDQHADFLKFVRIVANYMTAAQHFKIYKLLNTQFAKPELAKQLAEAIEAVIDERVADGNKNYEALLHKRP